MTKKIKLKENDLKNIPGVGKNMEQHFFDIGIFTIDDLIGQNPEELFLKDCLVKGLQVDRCDCMFFVYSYITQIVMSMRQKN